MPKKDLKEQMGKWLTAQFIQWQSESGEIRSIRDFAYHLAVDENYLAKWMRGYALPANENVILLGNKLGEEVYKILGWPVPQ